MFVLINQDGEIVMDDDGAAFAHIEDAAAIAASLVDESGLLDALNEVEIYELIHAGTTRKVVVTQTVDQYGDELDV